jgi:hypothetical protein
VSKTSNAVDILYARYKPKCKNGHEWSRATIYINKTSGARVCRTCRAESQKRCRRREG